MTHPRMSSEIPKTQIHMCTFRDCNGSVEGRARGSTFVLQRITEVSQHLCCNKSKFLDACVSPPFLLQVGSEKPFIHLEEISSPQRNLTENQHRQTQHSPPQGVGHHSDTQHFFLPQAFGPAPKQPQEQETGNRLLPPLTPRASSQHKWLNITEQPQGIPARTRLPGSRRSKFSRELEVVPFPFPAAFNEHRMSKTTPSTLSAWPPRVQGKGIPTQEVRQGI